MHCTFWFCFSILLTARSTAPTNESRLPSPKIIHPSLLSSLDTCNFAFVTLQAHCRHVTHCFRNVNPWWSIVLILSHDISLNRGPAVRNFKACLLNARSFDLIIVIDLIIIFKCLMNKNRTEYTNFIYNMYFIIFINFMHQCVV